MLIGAHVSTAGGLATAIERGTDLGCVAIQIVNQSPRVWNPNEYGPEDFAAFDAARRSSPIERVVIHSSYLVNCATTDSSLRAKSLTSLVHALRLGDAIGAVGVVLHPGAQKGEKLAPSLRRASEVILEALDASRSCRVLLEHTAGHNGLLGRDFDQIAALIELTGRTERVGLCLDTCHLYVQGYDVTTAEGVGAMLDEVAAKVGLDRLHCLHINDARDPLGSRRDRHANIGRGTMGPEGLAAVLSEPRLEGLPAILETPGPVKKGPDRAEVDAAWRLRRQGLETRRSAAPPPHPQPPTRRRGRRGGLLARWRRPSARSAR